MEGCTPDSDTTALSSKYRSSLTIFNSVKFIPPAPMISLEGCGILEEGISPYAFRLYGPAVLRSIPTSNLFEIVI
jgi:hypothetical protein